MEKSTIISLRKKLKMGKNLPLRIRTDENYVYDESNSFVMWDDAKSLLWMVHHNQYRETNVSCPVEILVVDYDRIVNMSVALNSEDAKTIGVQLAAAGLTTAELINKYINDLVDMTKVNMYVDPNSEGFDESIVKKTNYPFDGPKSAEHESNTEGASSTGGSITEEDDDFNF